MGKQRLSILGPHMRRACRECLLGTDIPDIAARPISDERKTSDVQISDVHAKLHEF